MIAKRLQHENLANFHAFIIISIFIIHTLGIDLPKSLKHETFTSSRGNSVMALMHKRLAILKAKVKNLNGLILRIPQVS